MREPSYVLALKDVGPFDIGNYKTVRNVGRHRLERPGAARPGQVNGEIGEARRGGWPPGGLQSHEKYALIL